MRDMSTSSTRTTLRRVALAAAPAAVLALSLSACAPHHITSMDSPTPASSHLATESASDEAGTESSSAPASSESAAADAGVFSTTKPMTYTVKTLTVNGSDVATGSVRAIAISGDAASDAGATITPLGDCSGSLFSAKGTATQVTASAAVAGQSDKCTSAADAKVATDLASVLKGKLKVTEQGNDVLLTGKNGSLQLQITQ